MLAQGRHTCVRIAVATWLLALGPVAAAGAASGPTPDLRTEHLLLRATPGAMAEPNVAIDARNPSHMAVAADPYLDPTCIQISVTTNAGRTWSAAMTVLPPGERKSYDPQLGYAADGTLLVTGGASADTRDGCLRASKVFIAALHGTQFTYHVIAAAPAGALLDRPTLLITPVPKLQLVVGWTTSPGPGAECSLRPSRSHTQVALLTSQLGVRTVATLPSVAQAPFGSALAISGEGVLGLAVAARDRSDNLIIGIYQSSDGTHWQFSPAGSAKAEPDELAGLGGVVLSMPSIAGLPHGFAVAWTDATGGIERTRIARNDTGAWKDVAPPPARGRRLLPTLAVAGETLVLVQAGLTPAGLTFYTWQQRGSAWSSVATDPGGRALDRREVGELLGLAATAQGGRISAFPVDVAGFSALLVRTRTPAQQPTATASASASQTKRKDPVAGEPSDAGGSVSTRVLLGLGAVLAGLAGLLALGRERARRLRRRRSRRPHR